MADDFSPNSGEEEEEGTADLSAEASAKADNGRMKTAEEEAKTGQMSGPCP